MTVNGWLPIHTGHLTMRRSIVCIQVQSPGILLTILGNLRFCGNFSSFLNILTNNLVLVGLTRFRTIIGNLL